MFLLTLGTSTVMAALGLAATTNCGGGSGGWAIPANTALLIALAFIQQKHYRRTAQVERIVDKRKTNIFPPPDSELKRKDDPPA